MADIQWEIQKGVFSSLDISIELWGLYLFTKVEYILFCSIYASKKDFKN